MKRFVAWIAFFALPLAAYPDTVALGARGTLTIAVPPGWTLSSHKEEDTGVAITLAPPAAVNAKCLLNVTFVAEPKPVAKEMVDEQVLSVCDQFVDQSVEKRKTLQEFGMPAGAYGSYCVFTDASMVGKPSKPDEFKVIAIGIIHFRDDLMAAVSIAADDTGGADFSSMLAAVRSASVSPGKTSP